ncbi:MAG: glycosyltransferase family 2 protein, partial [Actinobacteria bacterium]|nr:glycosyltransferase family 2 protein [Actinomycetota bacterium]
MVSVLRGNRLGSGSAAPERATATAKPPAARRHRAAALLRQHWLAAALLTLGLVLRVLALLAYRPALFYIDSFKYIYGAQGIDPEGYKAPLRAILFVANFDTVAAVQHLLGLAMAVTIYLLLLRRGASRWLAALAIAPILLDGYQLQQEQTIMPTTWFGALIVAGLAVLLWRPDPGWRRVIAAGLILGTSATVAQVGQALLLPAVVYLLVLGGGWRRATGRAGTLIAAFAVPILAYSTGSYFAAGQFGLSHQGV